MTQPTGPTERYEIHIIGQLALRWAPFFEGMTITTHDDGTSLIHGTVADQSALHGLIRKLGDLGLPLISVRPAAGDSQPRTVPIRADQPLRTDHNPTRSTS